MSKIDLEVSAIIFLAELFKSELFSCTFDHVKVVPTPPRLEVLENPVLKIPSTLVLLLYTQGGEKRKNKQNKKKDEL